MNRDFNKMDKKSVRMEYNDGLIKCPWCDTLFDGVLSDPYAREVVKCPHCKRKFTVESYNAVIYETRKGWK